MARFKTLDDLKPSGRRVLVRVDFNVPMRDGQVTDASRIERSLPTIRDLTERGARVVLISHLGRPKGQRNPDLSLRSVAAALSSALGDQPVAFAEDCIGDAAEQAVAGLGDGGIALLENLRFHAEEEVNDAAFAAALARLADFYVDDAFSAAHRAHASVEAIAKLLPAAAGRLMEAELTHLAEALETPERPLAIVVGGAKISTKLDLLRNLIEKADMLMVGGGMANTFLHAQGTEVGASLCEREMGEVAREVLVHAKEVACEVILPSDAVVASELKPGVPTEVVPVTDVRPDQMILDIGPETADMLGRCLDGCRTLLWNGPLGCFEVPPFDEGTNAVAKSAAALTRAGRLRSVAGGGDTIAALAHAGAVDDFSYVSTAGGAFLEWLEGKPLPGVAALERAAV